MISLKTISGELKVYAPFTLFGALTGIGIMLLMVFFQAPRRVSEFALWTSPPFPRASERPGPALDRAGGIIQGPAGPGWKILPGAMLGGARGHRSDASKNPSPLGPRVPF
jgi:hypothetical protein